MTLPDGVFVCPGCGVLAVDGHACLGMSDWREQAADWLATVDPDTLDQAVLNRSDFSESAMMTALEVLIEMLKGGGDDPRRDP